MSSKFFVPCPQITDDESSDAESDEGSVQPRNEIQTIPSSAAKRRIGQKRLPQSVTAAAPTSAGDDSGSESAESDGCRRDNVGKNEAKDSVPPLKRVNLRPAFRKQSSRSVLLIYNLLNT